MVGAGIVLGRNVCVITTRNNLCSFKENGQGGTPCPFFFAGCDNNIASAYPALTDAVYAGSQLLSLNPDPDLQQHQQVIHQIRRLVGQLKASCTVAASAVSTPSSPTFCAIVWCRWHTVWQCKRFPGRQISFGEQLFQLIQEQPLVSGVAKQLLVPLWQVGPMGFASTSKCRCRSPAQYLLR